MGLNSETLDSIRETIPLGLLACRAKPVKFPSVNQLVLSSSLVINIGNRSTVKNPTNSEIDKLF